VSLAQEVYNLDQVEEEQPMPDQIQETRGERESRLLLIKFLTITDPLLERLLQSLIPDTHKLANRVRPQLDQIWTFAKANLEGVAKSIRIGLSRTRRRALNRVGMFGKALAAKWELLSFDIQEGAVKRILKRLNSMFSSLSKVFPVLHSVMEFKDHVEATVEGLTDTPEFITLGL